jgi:hypothetical protein
MKRPAPSPRITFGGAAAFLFLMALGATLSRPGEAASDASRPPPPAAARQTPAPTPKHFDLVAQNFDPAAPQYDANQLLLNPQWGWQQNNPRDPADPLKHYPDPFDTDLCPDHDFKSCTSTKTDIDKAGACTFLVCGFCPPSQIGFCPKPGTRVRGHVNWVAATYTGTNCWNNVSFPDMDYTLNFIPDGRAGLTFRNHPNQNVRGPGGVPATPKEPLAIHTEFDSRATVKGFNTPRWKELRGLVDPCETDADCDKEVIRKVLDGRRAVVLGLVGLDSEHTGYSELHPVYVLAVEVEPNPDDNVWLVFARNRGTQGFCGQEDHPLPFDEVKLLIPKPPGAQLGGVEFAAGTQFSTNLEGSCPAPADFRFFGDTTFSNHEGVLVNFRLPQRLDLPEPFVGPLVEGEIHLKWIPQTGGTLTAAAPERARCKPLEKVPEAEEALTERELTPEEKAAVLRATEARLATRTLPTKWTTCVIPSGPILHGAALTESVSRAMRADRPRLTRMEGKKADRVSAFRKAVIDTLCTGRNGETYKCRK